MTTTPSTGGTNADTFLSAFGSSEARLDDATTVNGIFKTRREAFYTETESVTRRAYRLFVPSDRLGNLVQDSRLLIDGVYYNAVYLGDDEDGWTEITLSKIGV